MERLRPTKIVVLDVHDTGGHWPGPVMHAQSILPASITRNLLSRLGT